MHIKICPACHIHSGSGMFTKQEIDKIVGIGYLDGLFVLAHSIDLIKHTFD
ncbi:hypothetical protein ACS0TY_024965 [Phlomoides rotata]